MELVNKGICNTGTPFNEGLYNKGTYNKGNDITINRLLEKCQDCNGTGANESKDDKCPECKGRGQL